MGILDSMRNAARRFGKPQPAREAALQLDKEFLIGKIRQTSLFANVPAENLDVMFSHMDMVSVKKGQTVIREGSEGDYYYLLAKGTAKVTRKTTAGGVELVAEIVEPTGFGEEALISNRKRNATVAMTSDGRLMRLSKDAFSEYIKKPLVKWLFPTEALALVSKGARWVDVRAPEELLRNRLPGSLSIPLDEVRDRADELDRETVYICYCQNGRLSSTAAFLLRQRGYNAAVLRGGVQAMKRGE